MEECLPRLRARDRGERRVRQRKVLDKAGGAQRPKVVRVCKRAA